MKKRTIQSTRRLGRPSKFGEPSHPITVTLPERVLGMLQQFDPDRAQAITRVTEQVLGERKSPRPRVEVIEMAPGTGLIVIESSNLLRRLPWMKLVEIAPRRFIITINSGVTIETLEIGLQDLLESARAESSGEQELIEQLLGWIHTLRRNRNITKAELLFVATGAQRRG